MRECEKHPSVTHGWGLAVLLLLFCFRVGAQLVQWISPVSFLPPFDAWQSGALPYEWLLASQFVIILLCASVVFKFLKGQIHARASVGIKCLIVGGLYMTVMVFRLVAGLTFAAGHHWLDARIPTFFHLVLASFILLTGHFHYFRRNPEE